jgi:hypothetical protein
MQNLQTPYSIFAHMNINRQIMHPSHPTTEEIPFFPNATWKANMGKSGDLCRSSNIMLYLRDDGCEAARHAYFTA